MMCPSLALLLAWSAPPATDARSAEVNRQGTAIVRERRAPIPVPAPKTEEFVLKSYRLKHSHAPEAGEALRQFFARSGRPLTVVVLAKNNSLLVYTESARHAKVAKIVEVLDDPDE